MSNNAKVERYRLLITAEDSKHDGFLEKLEEESKSCGAISITCNSGSEIIIEGENVPVLKLIAWLSSGSRLKRLRRLEQVPEEKS